MEQQQQQKAHTHTHTHIQAQTTKGVQHRRHPLLEEFFVSHGVFFLIERGVKLYTPMKFRSKKVVLSTPSS